MRIALPARLRSRLRVNCPSPQQPAPPPHRRGLVRVRGHIVRFAGIACRTETEDLLRFLPPLFSLHRDFGHLHAGESDQRAVCLGRDIMSRTVNTALNVYLLYPATCRTLRHKGKVSRGRPRVALHSYAPREDKIVTLTPAGYETGCLGENPLLPEICGRAARCPEPSPTGGKSEMGMA